MLVVVAFSNAGAPAVDVALLGVSVIPSPRETAWSAMRQHDRRGQSKGATTPAGVVTITTRADRETVVITRRRLVWPAAGCGDHVTRRRPSQPAPAPRRRCRCCGRGGPRPSPAPPPAGSLAGCVAPPPPRPSGPAAALLGDPAAVHGGVGFVVLRRQTCPTTPACPDHRIGAHHRSRRRTPPPGIDPTPGIVFTAAKPGHRHVHPRRRGTCRCHHHHHRRCRQLNVWAAGAAGGTRCVRRRYQHP